MAGTPPWKVYTAEGQEVVLASESYDEAAEIMLSRVALKRADDAGTKNEQESDGFVGRGPKKLDVGL